MALNGGLGNRVGISGTLPDGDYGGGSSGGKNPQSYVSKPPWNLGVELLRVEISISRLSLGVPAIHGTIRVFPFPSPLACRVPPMEARTTTAFLPEMFGHVAVSIRALREEGD